MKSHSGGCRRRRRPYRHRGRRSAAVASAVVLSSRKTNRVANPHELCHLLDLQATTSATDGSRHQYALLTTTPRAHCVAAQCLLFCGLLSSIPATKQVVVAPVVSLVPEVLTPQSWPVVLVVTSPPVALPLHYRL